MDHPSGFKEGSLKIICLEEHTVDADIARASQAVLTSEAGYMADWGSRVEDKPASFADNRPHLVSPKEAIAAAREVGASRIVAMPEVALHVFDSGVVLHVGGRRAPKRLMGHTWNAGRFS